MWNESVCRIHQGSEARATRTTLQPLEATGKRRHPLLAKRLFVQGARLSEPLVQSPECSPADFSCQHCCPGPFLTAEDPWPLVLQAAVWRLPVPPTAPSPLGWESSALAHRALVPRACSHSGRLPPVTGSTAVGRPSLLPLTSLSPVFTFQINSLHQECLGQPRLRHGSLRMHSHKALPWLWKTCWGQCPGCGSGVGVLL